jgi:predicted SAM-dependent methyltransferase
MKFEDLIHSNDIYLYLGDLPVQRRNYTNKNFIGLSLIQNNQYHIKHDVVKHIPLNDNTVNIVQSEDVMEHIEYHLLKDSINEIYRILKPGGLFRLSMPDYSCDVLYNRSKKDENGNLIFDSGGGGTYDEINKKVNGGGHVWFPKFSSVKSLLETTDFSNEKINYLHYYDMDNNPVTNKIDYSNGFISRTPDNDTRVQNPYRPMSIIVDCCK